MPTSKMRRITMKIMKMMQKKTSKKHG